jgi:class 3 adenylate cyclase
MGADEVGTLAALKKIRSEIVDPAIAGHKGRIVKTTGDGLLAEFGSAVDAVTCAIAVQELMAKRNENQSKITFRIPPAYPALRIALHTQTPHLWIMLIKPSLGSVSRCEYI